MEFPGQEGTQLLVLLSEIATAGKRITDLLASAKAWGNLELEQLTTLAVSLSTRYAFHTPQVLMLHVSPQSDAMQSAVLSTGFAQSYASVDKVEPKIGSGGGCYTVLVDPLNGATPADAAVACGTIFGIYRAPQIGSPDPAPFYRSGQISAFHARLLLLPATRVKRHELTITSLSAVAQDASRRAGSWRWPATCFMRLPPCWCLRLEMEFMVSR